MAIHVGKKIAILGSGFGFTELFPVLNSFNDVYTFLLRPRDPSLGLNNSFLDRAEYVSLDEIIKNEEIKLVFVALPPSLHLEYFQKLASSGKTVYLEKPAGLSEKEAIEIANVAKQTDTSLYLGFQFRFDPGLEFFAKETEHIRRNDPSFNISVSWQIAESNVPKTAWKNEIKMGGGVFRDHLCHVIDYIRYSFKFGNDEYIFNELQLATQKSLLLNEVGLKSDRINIEIKRGIFEESRWSISVSDSQSNFTISSVYPFDLDSYEFMTENRELDKELESRWVDTKVRLHAISPGFNSRRHALRSYIGRILQDEELSFGADGVKGLPNIFDAIYTQKFADKMIAVEELEY
jgi:predicted dehydrogenase